MCGMLAGMPVRGVVAAPDVSAVQADPQCAQFLPARRQGAQPDALAVPAGTRPHAGTGRCRARGSGPPGRCPRPSGAGRSRALWPSTASAACVRTCAETCRGSTTWSAPAAANGATSAWPRGRVTVCADMSVRAALITRNACRRRARPPRPAAPSAFPLPGGSPLRRVAADQPEPGGLGLGRAVRVQRGHDHRDATLPQRLGEVERGEPQADDHHVVAERCVVVDGVPLGGRTRRGRPAARTVHPRRSRGQRRAAQHESAVVATTSWDPSSLRPSGASPAAVPTVSRTKETRRSAPGAGPWPPPSGPGPRPPQRPPRW